eukprot:282698-Amorphochlora_amoeboformis.AAC.1
MYTIARYSNNIAWKVITHITCKHIHTPIHPEQKLGLVPHLCLPPLRPTSLPAAVPLAAEPYAQHQPIPQGPPPPYEEEGEEAGKAIDLTELLDDKQTNQQTGLPSPSLPTSTSDSRQGSQVGVIGWEENGGASDVQAMVEDKDVGNRNQPGM